MVDVGCRSGGGRCVLVVAVVASVVGLVVSVPASRLISDLRFESRPALL